MMTSRDAIYKNYENGGEAWATLSEAMHPLFKSFLNNSNFVNKYAFDIGCGTGRYLKLLQVEDFRTDGIDSSETAVEMTKRSLNATSNISCVDMYNFEIPKNKYDLIISISAIHHGTKKQIHSLIHKIYDALIENGKIFITIPDLKSSEFWGTFKDKKETEKGTFVPLSGPEIGLPHSFFAKEEVYELFSSFKDIQLDLDSHGRRVIQASK